MTSRDALSTGPSDAPTDPRDRSSEADDRDAVFRRYRAALDQEMRAAVPSPETSELYAMLHYHLGWRDEHGRPADVPSGKRLRPTLVLVACEAAGGDPAVAMPAAAGVELLHNFSLIHDDIQDRSEERRHRRTVWSLWGTAQAINAGDAMHAAAAMCALRCAERGATPETALEVARLLHACCLRLVEGQYLDLSFEPRSDVTADDYLRMIDGKTGALIAASVEIGALLGGDAANRSAWSGFGRALGRAFQIVDDILGVWGQSETIGKPTADDVVKGKRALPYLLAVAELSPPLTARLLELYSVGERDQAAVAEAVDLIGRSGARDLAARRAKAALEEALTHLDATGASGKGRADLQALARSFVERDR